MKTGDIFSLVTFEMFDLVFRPMTYEAVLSLYKVTKLINFTYVKTGTFNSLLVFY